MNLADSEDRAVACAEFVLGTLDEDDRRRLLAAMEKDESLQREVGFWQDRLMGLYKNLAAMDERKRRERTDLARAAGNRSDGDSAGSTAVPG